MDIYNIYSGIELAKVIYGLGGLVGGYYIYGEVIGNNPSPSFSSIVVTFILSIIWPISSPLIMVTKKMRGQTV